MVTLEPGDKVYVEGKVVQFTAGYATKVELFSPTDQYQAWVRNDLVQGTGAVVLNRSQAEVCLTALDVARRADEGFSAVAACGAVMQAIRDQMKPPPMDEPGLYGVVEAQHPVAAGHRIKWVHGEPNEHGNDWFALDGSGFARIWTDLIDPTPVRPGEGD